MKKINLLCVLALFAGTGAAAAEPTGEDLIKYRKAVMSSIGDHMGAAVQILRGQVAYKHLPQHTAALASMLTIAGDIFPAASATGDTEALPKVWSDPEAFAKAMKSAQDAAKALDTAVAGGDPAAIGEAFKNVGGSCKGCHDDFRKPQS